MIIQLIITSLVSIVNLITSFLPNITTLPSIGGYDIDTALVSGVGMFYTYTEAVWPIAVVFQGFLFLLTYYSVKMIFKFLFGHRAPGSH